MIVNPSERGWEVIYQRNHAMLAAALANAWGADFKVHPPRLWTETIVAVAQHDDEENFWSEDRSHLSDVGAPLDFRSEEGAVVLEKARYVTQQAKRQHRWIAALIARHHEHIYQDARKDNADLDAFLTGESKNIATWLDDLDISKETLEATYAIMRWSDRLSLILCQNQVPDMQRQLDITTGPDGEMIRVWKGASGDLHLSEWVFHQDEIAFDVESRLLTGSSYADGAELRQALDEAQVTLKQWRFCKEEASN